MCSHLLPCIPLIFFIFPRDSIPPTPPPPSHIHSCARALAHKGWKDGRLSRRASGGTAHLVLVEHGGRMARRTRLQGPGQGSYEEHHTVEGRGRIRQRGRSRPGFSSEGGAVAGPPTTRRRRRRRRGGRGTVLVVRSSSPPAGDGGGRRIAFAAAGRVRSDRRHMPRDRPPREEERAVRKRRCCRRSDVCVLRLPRASSGPLHGRARSMRHRGERGGTGGSAPGRKVGRVATSSHGQVGDRHLLQEDVS